MSVRSKGRLRGDVHFDRVSLGIKPRSLHTAPAKGTRAAVGMTPKRSDLKVGHDKTQRDG